MHIASNHSIKLAKSEYSLIKSISNPYNLHIWFQRLSMKLNYTKESYQPALYISNKAKNKTHTHEVHDLTFCCIEAFYQLSDTIFHQHKTNTAQQNYDYHFPNSFISLSDVFNHLIHLKNFLFLNIKLFLCKNSTI